jgi:hypothetical protein
MADEQCWSHLQCFEEADNVLDKRLRGVRTTCSPRGISMPTLIKREHMIRLRHRPTEGVPGVSIALKSV